MENKTKNQPNVLSNWKKMLTQHGYQTAQELSDVSGVPLNVIQKIESGVAPDSTYFPALASAFEISVNELRHLIGITDEVGENGEFISQRQSDQFS